MSAKITYQSSLEQRSRGAEYMIGVLRSFLRWQTSQLPTMTGRVFVLGSGPGASVPDGFDDKWRLATVNASQAIAVKLRCGIPDITLLGTSVLKDQPANREAQAVLAGKRTGALVCMEGRRRYSAARFHLLRLGYWYDSFHFLGRAERLRIVSDVVGLRIDETMKPSNGIVLALLCLHLGASRVVMSGFSLTQGGHAYNNANRGRQHISEDRIILMKAVERGLPLYTNDPVFSEESGVPLYGQMIAGSSAMSLATDGCGR